MQKPAIPESLQSCPNGHEAKVRESTWTCTDPGTNVKHGSKATGTITMTSPQHWHLHARYTCQCEIAFATSYPYGLTTHYAHRNPGQKVFVKEAAFFRSQGGLTQEWGKSWVPLVANDLFDAQRIAEATLPPWTPPEDTSPAPKNCAACAHSFMEPDDDLTCGHKDAGPVGIYTRHAAGKGGHCGPERPKFEQHPGRNPNGTLKSR